MSKYIRVCHVVSGDLWGGAESQVHQLIKCIIDKGNHQVFVITLNKGVLFDKLKEMPIVVTSFDENKMRLWAMIIKIRLFLKNNNIDMVHCHGFKENLLAGIAAKMFISCKIVRTHHGRGVVAGSFSKKLVERFNAHLLTDKMIAVSHELKKYLTVLGFPESKIVVIHNGIDCENLPKSKNAKKIIESLSIPSGSFVVGTASRIEKEKGHEYLLLAIKELVDDGLPVVLVIVGTGKLQKKYQLMAEKMDITKSVFFTGFREDVFNYINIFDLFVMMSLNEGIPLALIEAMCMGKPVVCSAVGGIPEVVTTGLNGILVPSRDHQSCASAIRKIIDQKELQVSFGENARKHVSKYFTSNKSAENTIKLYERVLRN